MPTCTHCGSNVNVACETAEQAANCATHTDLYRSALRTHDWYYNFSDDHNVWRRGQQQRIDIDRMQKKVDQQYEIWNMYAPKEYQG